MKAILVIDDEDLVCHYLRKALERHGYVVHTATSGQDALRCIEEGLRPELVILDLCMPVMDGNELIPLLMNGPAGGALRLLLTAYIDELRHDLRGHLHAIREKPIGYHELVEEVKKLIGDP